MQQLADDVVEARDVRIVGDGPLVQTPALVGATVGGSGVVGRVGQLREEPEKEGPLGVRLEEREGRLDRVTPESGAGTARHRSGAGRVHPRRESRDVVAELPELAGLKAHVARAREQARQGLELAHLVAGCETGRALPPLVGLETGEQRPQRRSAERGHVLRLREDRALARQAIEVGRLDHFGAHEAQVREAQVVGGDHHHVEGPRRLGATAAESHASRPGSKNGSRSPARYPGPGQRRPPAVILTQGPGPVGQHSPCRHRILRRLCAHSPSSPRRASRSWRWPPGSTASTAEMPRPMASRASTSRTTSIQRRPSSTRRCAEGASRSGTRTSWRASRSSPCRRPGTCTRPGCS